MIRQFGGVRRLSVMLAALPIIAACTVDNDTLGTRSTTPAGGEMFASYVAIGTSIGAGIQSGGINDSTQKEAYPYLLATAMGLIPGVDWYYPAFQMPGCPAPLINPLTGLRVAGATAPCAYRKPGSAAPVMHNVSIPSIRAAQVIDLLDLTFGPTDTLKLAQFITGSITPLDMAGRASATFVTLEIGANDVLGAATRGDTLLLTPLASYQASFTAIADSLTALGVSGVAVVNVPNVTVIPHFAGGVVLFCLKTGAPGCPVGPTPPFNSPMFTVDASCAPSAAGGVGDSMVVSFTTIGGFLRTLTDTTTGVHAAVLNCGAGTASTRDSTVRGDFTIPYPIVSKPELITIATRVATMNAFISAQVTTRNWALFDLNAALAAEKGAGRIPPFPSLSTPTALFGPLFSQDGVHPNGAGQRLMAQGLATAINTRYATTLTVP